MIIDLITIPETLTKIIIYNLITGLMIRMGKKKYNQKKANLSYPRFLTPGHFPQNLASSLNYTVTLCTCYGYNIDTAG